MYEPTIPIYRRVIVILLLLSSQPPQEVVELRPSDSKMSTADFVLHYLAELLPLRSASHTDLLQQLFIRLRSDLLREGRYPLPECIAD